MRAFWPEISACARRLGEAQLSLCSLQDRRAVLLGREPEARADLRAWARYLTDSMPEVRALPAEEGAIPLVTTSPAASPALKDEMLRVLTEGAHLLKG
jgi:hypothetical protein